MFSREEIKQLCLNLEEYKEYLRDLAQSLHDYEPDGLQQVYRNLRFMKDYNAKWGKFLRYSPYFRPWPYQEEMEAKISNPDELFGIALKCYQMGFRGVISISFIENRFKIKVLRFPAVNWYDALVVRFLGDRGQGQAMGIVSHKPECIDPKWHQTI